MLDGHGIVWSTHVSRFAELLLAKVPGLLKGLSGYTLSMFFESAVRNNTQNAQDFFEPLVNIVVPLRQSIRFKCQPMGTNFKFDKASQIQSVPIELYTLASFEGIDLSEKSFFKRVTFISPGNNV